MSLFMDFPVDTVDDLDAVVAGWVAGDDNIQIEVKISGRSIPYFKIERPDVKAAHAGFSYATGVGAYINLLDIPDGSFEASIHFGKESIARRISLTPRAKAQQAEEMRRRNNARLWCEAHLCCPNCKGDLRKENAAYICRNCGTTYPQALRSLDFLPENLRFAITPNPVTVSSNPYDPAALALIEETTRTGGTVLDCGAGFRNHRMDGVINLEITDYRSTDLCGSGQNLPFKDNSFDAVISLAVLEHVCDPFACAREMLRVVKPGGKIMCSVPFLQPEHNFPGHFFNMTQTGLMTLFPTGVETVSIEVPPHGHPIFSVQWILREYLAGLPDAERAAFAQMTIGEIGTIEPANFLGHPAATRLSADAAQRIACLNTIVFRKTA